MNTPRNSERRILKRVNVILGQDTLAWLDRVSSEIGENSGTAVSRSELLRAIVGAISDRNLRVVGCQTERDIRDAFHRFLSRP